jgi:hypothetical protein
MVAFADNAAALAVIRTSGIVEPAECRALGKMHSLAIVAVRTWRNVEAMHSPLN